MVAILLSLALMVGGVIHGAQATSMAMHMAAAAHGDGAMPGCDGCPGDDSGGMACAAPCLVPVAAVLPVTTSVAGAVTRAFVATRTQALVDHRHPPDPYPPRTPVLG